MSHIEDGLGAIAKAKSKLSPKKSRRKTEDGHAAVELHSRRRFGSKPRGALQRIESESLLDQEDDDGDSEDDGGDELHSSGFDLYRATDRSLSHILAARDLPRLRGRSHRCLLASCCAPHAARVAPAEPGQPGRACRPAHF